MRLLDVHGQELVGFAFHAVDDLVDHPGAADGDLVAIAAHVLDQDREVQLPAPRDEEHIGVPGLLDPQRHVRQQLFVEPLAQLTAGDVLAFLAGERRGVHLEVHGERRLVDLQARQAFGLVGVRDGRADREIVDAGDEHDVARDRLGLRHALEALEPEHLVDLRLTGELVAEHDRDFVARVQPAPPDLADADAADVARVVERVDAELQGPIDVVLGRYRNALQDRLEERLHGLAVGLRVERRPPLQRRGVDDGEVELLLGRAELVEQLEGVVDDPVGPRARPVELVHHDDRLEAERERLSRHEPRLGHRALDRIDEQQDAVDHPQDALHLAAEIGVARRIHDVDVHALEVDRAVLREDRDAALALEVVRVHHALDDASRARQRCPTAAAGGRRAWSCRGRRGR